MLLSAETAQAPGERSNPRNTATIGAMPKNRISKLVDLLTEEQVQQTVGEYLQLDGWRALRTDPVSDRKRGTGFGEVGMPDYLFVRYGDHTPLCRINCADAE